MHFQADCTDCSWQVRSASRESVTDQLERHARKEQHHVKFQRVNPVPA